MIRITLTTLLLFVATITNAATLAERVAELEASPGVGQGNAAANLDAGSITTIPQFPAWEVIRVTYLETTDDTLKANTITVAVKDRGEGTEQAFYYPRKPSVIPITPPVYDYISDRSTPFTYEQVESFANSAWKGIVNTSARDIKGFDAIPVDGKTVQISGEFHIADGTWEQRTYYIHVVDVAGSYAPTVANTNIKIERKL